MFVETSYCHFLRSSNTKSLLIPRNIDHAPNAAQAQALPPFRDNISNVNVTLHTVPEDDITSIFYDDDKIVSVNTEWISRSVVARLSSSRLLLRIKSIMSSNGVVYEKIAILGARDVLITFFSEDSAAEFLSTTHLSLSAHVISVTSGANYVHDGSRLTWINIYGIPLSLRSEDLIMLLGNSVGDSIAVHPDFFSRDRLDIASCLLAVKGNFIDKAVKVCWNNKTFRIHILETDKPILLDGFDYASESVKGSANTKENNTK